MGIRIRSIRFRVHLSDMHDGMIEEEILEKFSKFSNLDL